MKILLAILKDENGVTAIEYALLAATISIVVSASLYILGGSISNLFLKIRFPI